MFITASLPCYGIELEKEIDENGEVSSATCNSDLHPQSGDNDEMDAALFAIEAMLMEHFAAGVDVQCNAYVQGIETAMLFVEDQYGG